LFDVRRREFIALLGGAATWPLTARGQSSGPVRRVGALMNFAADAAGGKERLAAFRQGLQVAGWEEGLNLHIDTRWAEGGDAERRKQAAELVALNPEVVLVWATPSVFALQRVTRTVPIVFAGVIDPVGSGLVRSLARPGGNATGFVSFEYALAAKWLELLKEVAPQTTRVAVLRDPTIPGGVGQFAAIQTVAPIGLELSAIDLRDTAEIEQAVAAFARDANGGLIVTASVFGASYPDVIATIAARHKLPAVYPFRYFTNGLLSYGSDQIEDFRRAAGYVDRILRGARPADLPVQAPVKYELVINLKAAKAIGLEVPATIIARANEVIEYGPLPSPIE
jgi:putative ABC transport system substrate-binding protein